MAGDGQNHLWDGVIVSESISKTMRTTVRKPVDRRRGGAPGWRRVATMETACRRIDQLHALLSLSEPIACGLVKGFFVDDLWNKAIPHRWHDPLEQLPLEQLAILLTDGTPPQTSSVWPLSLLAFVTACHAHRLPGQLMPRGDSESQPARANLQGRCDEERAINTELRCQVKPKKMHEIVRLSDASDRVGRAASCDTAVDVGSGLGYFSRTLAFERAWDTIGIEAVASNVHAAREIDKRVRSKMLHKLAHNWSPGLLRHIIAYVPTTMSSDAFLSLLVQPLMESAIATPERLPSQASSCTGEAYPGRVLDTCFGHKECTVKQRRIALLGLHTCGDLACTLLRIFDSAGDSVGCIVNVGCCYMHITEAGCVAPTAAPRQLSQAEWERNNPCAVMLTTTAPSTESAELVKEDDAYSECVCCESYPNGNVLPPSSPCFTARSPATECHVVQDTEVALGFPMSKYVRSRGIRLGYHIREMACHSSSSYAARLRETTQCGEAGERALQLHARRAVLEILLQRRAGYDQLKRAKCGTIKGAANLSFEEYCDKCFEKVGLPLLSQTERSEAVRELAPLLARWRQVVVYFVLRQMLAPLWEALILLDRLVYLGERGHHAALFPIFDPMLSPRNFALVGARPSAETTADRFAEALPSEALVVLQ
eukprot:scaffold222568_cov36-Tisochrysis_lutea.AAC.1